MPEPNRHYSIAGLIGLALWGHFMTWWSLLLGALIAFVLHIPLDWLFNEFWERKPWQTIVLGAVGGLALIASVIAACWAYRWWAALLILAAALAMDLDDILPRIRDKVINTQSLQRFVPLVKWMPMRAIWPCHWGAPDYIVILGKDLRWYRDPWCKEEPFWRTLVLAVLSSLIMIFLVYAL